MRTTKSTTSTSDVVQNAKLPTKRKEKIMTIPSDQAQIATMKRLERERAVYENSRRDCFDLARNSYLSVKEIHFALTEGYGDGAISISSVRRICNNTRR